MEARIRAEQVAALFKNVAWSVLSAAAASVGLSTLMVRLGVTAWPAAMAWSLYIGLGAGLHLLLARGYRRATAADARRPLWPLGFTAVCLFEGLGWGWAPVFLVGPGHFDSDLLVLAATLSVAAGSISAFGPYLPAYGVFFLAATTPYALSSFEGLTQLERASTPLMLLYIVGIGGLGVASNRNFRELVRLRLQTSQMAEELREQKDVAERANLAKSSFLAAASHDLRQPVHALGLFVGALRGVPLSPEATRLVDQIEASTAAMDTLFCALLDISRLDAGVVEVHPEVFALQPLLDRICREHAEEAEAKGVALRWRRTGAHVRSDPVLVERILRNLISNAVRHTEAGGVLVGCRRGTAVSVEVWDTGPGIPDHLHDKVFQEYFQLANPERDRTKGLGLGLAIVRRLTELLGCGLSLRSRMGRGSCFGIALPRAQPSDPAPPAAALVAAAGLGRGLVLVVDDESAIRDAMAVLLTGWGYRVAAAGSGDEALAALAGAAPDLIVCDYRLREGETGIGMVGRLYREFGERIPAMLITGDTAPDRLAEAQASGLVLLHKPVSNGKLRAAMVNLMQGQRQEGPAVSEAAGAEPVR